MIGLCKSSRTNQRPRCRHVLLRLFTRLMAASSSAQSLRRCDTRGLAGAQGENWGKILLGVWSFFFLWLLCFREDIRAFWCRWKRVKRSSVGVLRAGVGCVQPRLMPQYAADQHALRQAQQPSDKRLQGRCKHLPIARRALEVLFIASVAVPALVLVSRRRRHPALASVSLQSIAPDLLLVPGVWNLLHLLRLGLLISGRSFPKRSVSSSGTCSSQSLSHAGHVHCSLRLV